MVLCAALPLGALAAAPPPGLGDPVNASDADYQKLRQLQQRSGAPALPEGGASVGEVGLAAAELAQGAVVGKADLAWKTEDYDALYALLQRYRDALRKMGFDQSALEDQLAGLKVRAASLEERLARLHPRDGMKVHGKALTFYDNLLQTGPGQDSGRTTRYEHGLQRVNLDFQFTRGPVSAGFDLNFQAIYDLYSSCATCRGGFDRLYVEARLPVSLEAGDMSAKLTPLTLWRNEDPSPFEAGIFKLRKEEMRDDLHLESGAFRIFGARASTDMKLFGAQALELELMTLQFNTPGTTIFTRDAIEPPQGDTYAGKSMSLPYSNYFVAWRTGLPLPWGLGLSYQGTILRDAPNSSYYLYAYGPLNGQVLRGYDSQVHSASLGLVAGSFGLALEGAQSLFSSPAHHAFGASDYLTGTAWTAVAALHTGALGLSLSARAVSRNYLATAAQTRTELYGKYPLGPFTTENSIYNSGTGYYGNVYGGGTVIPESNFDNGFLPPVLFDALGANTVNAPMGTDAALLPYDPLRNTSRPYGLATPNRAGYGLDVELAPWDRTLVLSGGWEGLVEPEAPSNRSALAFTDLRAGATLDLKPRVGWPLSLGGGYALRDMRGGRLAFSAAQVDLGLDWQATPSTKLMLGAQHIDANGSVAYRGTSAALNLAGYNLLHNVAELGSAGLLFALDDGVEIRLTYSNGILKDLLKPANDHAFEQTFVRMSILY